MKTTMKLGAVVVMAGMIVSSFLVIGAQAYYKAINYKNGATWTVNRPGGGTVQKEYTAPNNSTYINTRTCSNGTCQTSKQVQIL